MDIQENDERLSIGTELSDGRYRIESFLNSGGFGMTYLAKNTLDSIVVIKECYPSMICRRDDRNVSARTSEVRGDYESSVNWFEREARKLSTFRNDNIVRVHDLFRENGTAYMVLDFVQGKDLFETIQDYAHKLTPDFIVRMTHELLPALDYIHSHDMLHRDISPDNLMLDQEGRPIMIDFGAAREEATRKSRALSSLQVVKDGYSPQEFYVVGSNQGPFSDVYALAATLHHCITNKTPPSSQARLAAVAEDSPDPMPILAGAYEGYPDGFLEAVDKGLQIAPRNRWQSAEEWRLALGGKAQTRIVEQAPAPQTRVVAGGQGEAAQTRAAPITPNTGDDLTPATKNNKAGLVVGLLIAVAVAGGIGYEVWDQGGGGTSSTEKKNVSTPIETLSPGVDGRKLDFAALIEGGGPPEVTGDGEYGSAPPTPAHLGRVPPLPPITADSSRKFDGGILVTPLSAITPIPEPDGNPDPTPTLDPIPAGDGPTVIVPDPNKPIPPGEWTDFDVPTATPNPIQQDSRAEPDVDPIPDPTPDPTPIVTTNVSVSVDSNTVWLNFNLLPGDDGANLTIDTTVHTDLLRSGDRLISVDGRALGDLDELIAYLDEVSARITNAGLPQFRDRQMIFEVRRAIGGRFDFVRVPYQFCDYVHFGGSQRFMQVHQESISLYLFPEDNSVICDVGAGLDAYTLFLDEATYGASVANAEELGRVVERLIADGRDSGTFTVQTNGARRTITVPLSDLVR